MNLFSEFIYFVFKAGNDYIEDYSGEEEEEIETRIISLSPTEFFIEEKPVRFENQLPRRKTPSSSTTTGRRTTTARSTAISKSTTGSRFIYVIVTVP